MTTNVQKLQALVGRFGWLRCSQSMGRDEVFQKTIFILQTMGIEYGYCFRLSFHGPHCVALVDDCHSLLRIVRANIPVEKEYTIQAEEILDNFAFLFWNTRTNVVWLEIVSSLLFMQRLYHKTGDDLKQLFLYRRRHFRNSMLVEEAMNLITMYEFFFYGRKHVV